MGQAVLTCIFSIVQDESQVEKEEGSSAQAQAKEDEGEIVSFPVARPLTSTPSSRAG